MLHTIRTGFIALFVLVSIVPLLFVGGLLMWQTYHREQQHTLDLQREISLRAAVQLSTFIETAEDELRVTIQMTDFKASQRARQEEILTQAIFFTPIFDDLALLDHTGQEQMRVSRLGVIPEANLHNRAMDEVFHVPFRTNKTFYGPIRLNPLNGEPLLLLGVPMLDVATGTPNGVLVGEVRLRQVLERVTNTHFGLNGSVTVINADGEIIAHRDPQILAQNLQVDVDVDVSDGIGIGVIGEPAFIINHPVNIGDLVLYIIVERPLDEAQAPLQQTLRTTVLLLLATMTGAMVLAILAVNHLVRPIQTLAATAQRISTGDLFQQVAVTRKDEIGMLQRNFNQMVTNLCEQRDAIEHHNEVLRIFKALADHAPDHIAVTTLDGQVTYRNESHQAQYQTNGNQSGIAMTDMVDGAEYERLHQEILPHIHANSSWVGQIMHRRSDGTTFPVQGAGFAVLDETEELQAIAWITRDITEQLRAEAERTALQQHVIEAQQAAIRELSTPLIPLSESVVIMPLIGTIDSQRAQMVMEALLDGVARHRATLVILDITGVSVVDTQVAQTFIQAAQAVRLLGAQVMLTGIQPAIAQTLVHLGINLSGIATRSTLQDGITIALGRPARS